MDSPQYVSNHKFTPEQVECFKPYYKWIVLNTLNLKRDIDFMTF